MAMGELSKLPNLGKELERQLEEIGINTFEELKQLGSKGAWLKIYERDESACTNRLLALEGAVQGVKKTLLDEETKMELKIFVKSTKTSK